MDNGTRDKKEEGRQDGKSAPAKIFSDPTPALLVPFKKLPSAHAVLVGFGPPGGTRILFDIPTEGGKNFPFPFLGSFLHNTVEFPPLFGGMVGGSPRLPAHYTTTFFSFRMCAQ